MRIIKGDSKVNEMEVLNGSKLNEIATASPTAEVVVSSLAARERLRSSSDITRTKTVLMKTGNRIDEQEYMNFWKDLAAAGVGSIVYGRKGKPDRFNWFYDLKTVAKAALQGKDQEAPQLDTAKPHQTKKKRGRPFKHGPPSEDKKHIYDVIVQKVLNIKLRPDFNMELKVPNDLTPDEINKITSSLKELAS